MLGCRCLASRESSSSNHGRRTMRPALTGTREQILHFLHQSEMTNDFYSNIRRGQCSIVVAVHAHGGLAIEKCRVPWDIQNVKHTQLKLGISFHSLLRAHLWLVVAVAHLIDSRAMLDREQFHYMWRDEQWQLVIRHVTSYFSSWKNAFVMQSIVVNSVFYLGREFLRRHQV